MAQNAVINLLMMLCLGMGAIGSIKQGIWDENDVVSWNAMISGCTSNGRVDNAKELFDSTPGRNVFCWTTMTFGFVKVRGHVAGKTSLLTECPPKTQRHCECDGFLVHRFRRR